MAGELQRRDIRYSVSSVDNVDSYRYERWTHVSEHARTHAALRRRLAVEKIIHLVLFAIVMNNGHFNLL